MESRKARIMLPSLLLCIFLALSMTSATAQQKAGSPASESSNVAANSVGEPTNIGSNKVLAMQLTQRIRQAGALRLKWKLAEAETLWREVLSIDSGNREALLGMAEIERARLNYPQALEYLKKVSELPVDSTTSLSQLLVSYGTLYLTLEEPDKAAEYFARAREVSSNYSGALLGEAGVALLKRDYSKAEKLLEDLIKSDPNRVEAYISLARVYLEENRNALAAYQAQKALDMDKFNVDAMAALCAVKIAEKKPESVRKLAKSVLELNPYNSGVRRLLSQYLNSRRAYQTKTNPEVQALINHAEQMRSLGKYEQAIVDFKQVVQLDPKSIRGWLGIGSCQLSLNDYRAAAEAADKALQMDSENALAHLQLSLAHSGMHEEARIKAEAIDWRDRYFNRATLPLPSGIEDVFVNFSTLSTNEQQVIIHAVAPLASYLSDLKRKGAKHYLLSTDKKLSEVAGYESLESRMTFDGRYYASVRGVGGLVTVSGVEYLDVTMRGGFNTIAHEFAHQVHTSAFSPELCERIKKLYQKALKNGHVLDYYASSNEWEYFAQGYEAYISMFKRPNTGVTARHTRSELQRVDPDLYDLIEELAKQDEYYKRVEKSLTVIQ